MISLKHLFIVFCAHRMFSGWQHCLRNITIVVDYLGTFLEFWTAPDPHTSETEEAILQNPV